METAAWGDMYAIEGAMHTSPRPAQVRLQAACLSRVNLPAAVAHLMIREGCMHRRCLSAQTFDIVISRYILGSARDGLYVALQGTKHGRDLVTDLNFRFNPIWDDADEQLPQPLVGLRILTCVQAPLWAFNRLCACMSLLCLDGVADITFLSAVSTPWLLGAIPPDPSRGVAGMGAVARPPLGILWPFPGRCPALSFAELHSSQFRPAFTLDGSTS